MAKHKKQTARGKAQDKRKTSKQTLPKTRANVTKWRRAKNRIDIEGVDTKQKKAKRSKPPKTKTQATKTINLMGGGDTIKISKKTQEAQQSGKKSKTQKAKDLIRADYAKHGKDTGVAMRAYTENRISFQTYQDLAAAGMKIYNRK